jgi:hypothetical protein
MWRETMMIFQMIKSYIQTYKKWKICVNIFQARQMWRETMRKTHLTRHKLLCGEVMVDERLKHDNDEMMCSWVVRLLQWN